MEKISKIPAKSRGISLIEIIVAVFLFSLIFLAISNMFISGLKSQRNSLAYQELLGQTSYVAEYMSRSLRMATKEPDPPVCLSAAGLNYETIPNGVKFTDYQGFCTEFFLDPADQILKKREKIGLPLEEAVFNLTSPKLKVNAFSVNLLGEAEGDALQPRVTFSLYVENREEPVKIQMQTTVSQRNIDVPL